MNKINSFSNQNQRSKQNFYKEEITHYSNCLSRDMHICIYGHGGVPFLAFPTQDSKCHNYEEFGMINELSDYLEDGKIQYFVVDTIDKESWSEGDWDLGRRAWKQELREMHTAAMGKLQLMVRRAALPISRKVSEGLNMPSSRSGTNWNTRKPETIRTSAALQAIFRVFTIRSGLRAP